VGREGDRVRMEVVGNAAAGELVVYWFSVNETVVVAR
jgi:hypothetical protein